MLRGVGRLARPASAGHRIVLDVPRPSVGIFDRVDQDEGLREDQVDARVPPRRQQMIGLRHRSPTRADLVAVDAMHERRDHRQFGDERICLGIRQASGLCQARQIRLHVVEAGHALRRPDDEDDERPSLPTIRISDQVRAVGCGLRQRLEIAHDLVRWRDLLSEVVAYDVLDDAPSAA